MLLMQNTFTKWPRSTMRLAISANRVSCPPTLGGYSSVNIAIFISQMECEECKGFLRPLSNTPGLIRWLRPTIPYRGDRSIQQKLSTGSRFKGCDSLNFLFRSDHSAHANKKPVQVHISAQTHRDRSSKTIISPRSSYTTLDFVAA